MTRRKRDMLDDLDSDSSDGGSELEDNFDPNEDPDVRAERALHEDPYQRKRRRRNEKEDAIYGVFGDDSEDERLEKRKGGKTQKRSDWTKAPNFVSAPKPGTEENEVDEGMEVDSEDDVNDENNQVSDDAEEDDEDSDGSSNADSTRPASPRVREPEEEDDTPQPRFGGGIGSGGIGSGGIGSGGIGSGGIGSGGIGSGGIGSRSTKSGGIGSRNATDSTGGREGPRVGGIGFSSSRTETLEATLPTSFGSKPSGMRSFVREEAPPPRTATPLSASEATHFSKLSGTFGARMLAKMGWQAGTGLGTEGEGIIAPIESKLRPKGAGIAFAGFKERTKQSLSEAKRRGEEISEDEGDVKVKKGRGAPTKKGEGKRNEVWKKAKKVKIRVEHKTYEQILEEAGETHPGSGLGQIIDATGATPREVSSLAEVSSASWTPSTDATRIPEVRHNIRLIVEASKADLDGLAREAKAIEDRKRAIAAEELHLSKKVQEEANLIARLQQVHLVTDEIAVQSKEAAQSYDASLETFTPSFEKLLAQYTKEYERYNLDEIVVAAVAPMFRRMIARWEPLEDPTAFTATFRMWRALLRTSTVQEPENQVDMYGTQTVVNVPIIEKPMTPFESLLWNAWLPKIRSCINNDWDPSNPGPLVNLYEAWTSLLPPFIRDNFFDQLVLPKLHKAVQDWVPRKATVPLRTLVFPWLPHVGLRVENVLDDARRKLKSLLRSWTAADETPSDLTSWKEVFDKSEWDSMMLKYVVPKLGSILRDDFRVNPRKQDMTPLERVLAWSTLLRPSIFAPLLETEFFPKWLDVLHIWLTQPRPSYEEISQWYSFWKSALPEHVHAMPGVQAGFTKGLQMMNTAIELGPDAPTKLPKPEHGSSGSATVASEAVKKAQQQAARPSARTQEITFRSIVEEHAAQHNLLFIPAGRVHEVSRQPLFKVSQRADGKGGLLVYIDDDAVWAQDGDVWRAVNLDTMVLRAMKGA